MWDQMPRCQRTREGGLGADRDHAPNRPKPGKGAAAVKEGGIGSPSCCWEKGCFKRQISGGNERCQLPSPRNALTRPWAPLMLQISLTFNKQAPAKLKINAEAATGRNEHKPAMLPTQVRNTWFYRLFWNWMGNLQRPNQRQQI